MPATPDITSQPPIVVIDASVWVSDALPSDVNFADSSRFMTQARTVGYRVVVPTLCLIEVAAAIGRRMGDMAAANHASLVIWRFPKRQLVSLTQQRAQNGVRVAMQARLRGADAVYLALAQEFGATLVTWDKEVVTRAGALVSVVTPTDWLAGNATGAAGT